MSPSSTAAFSHGRLWKLLSAFLFALLVLREWASSRICSSAIWQESKTRASSSEAPRRASTTSRLATEDAATSSPTALAITTTASAAMPAAPQLRDNAFQPWISDPEWFRSSRTFCAPEGFNAGETSESRCSKLSFSVRGNTARMHFLAESSQACLVATWPVEAAVAVLPNYTLKKDGSFCRSAGKNRSNFLDIGLRSGTCKVTVLSTREKCAETFHKWHNIWCLWQLSGSHCDIASTTERHRLLLRLSGVPRMVDAGANVGDSALVLAGYGNEVFAFEPGPNYLPAYTLNFMANSWLLKTGKYQLNLIAEGAGDSTATFWYPGRGSTFQTLHPDKKQCEKRIIKHSDDHCIPLKVGRVDNTVPDGLPIGLFKIDVEGLEARVLWGAHKLFCSSAPPRIIEFESVRGGGVPQCGVPSDYYGRDCQTLFERMVTRLYNFGYNCSFVTESLLDQRMLSIDMSTIGGLKQDSLETMRSESLRVGLGVESLQALLQYVPARGYKNVWCFWRRSQERGVCTGPQT